MSRGQMGSRAGEATSSCKELFLAALVIHNTAVSFHDITHQPLCDWLRWLYMTILHGIGIIYSRLSFKWWSHPTYTPVYELIAFL